jgi:hypothetical protein
VRALPAIAALAAFAALASPALAEPAACAWVYDATRCRTADEWRAEASTWCERAAQSTVRRWDMQRRGYATNRMFLTPMAAEFVREGAFEAVAGQICAGEQAGLAQAEARAAANMDH